jgi:hypothetical protein
MNQTLVIDFVIVCMVVLLAFSPTYVFSLIERYLFNVEGRSPLDRDIFSETVDIHVGNGDDLFHNPVRVARDAEVISNLRKVVVRTEGTPAHQTWKIKLWEFERKLQWNNLMDRTDGYERVANV